MPPALRLGVDGPPRPPGDVGMACAMWRRVADDHGRVARPAHAGDLCAGRVERHGLHAWRALAAGSEHGVCVAACARDGRLRRLTQMLRRLSTIKVSIVTYGSERTNNIVRRNGITEGYEGVDEVWPPSRPTLATLDVLNALRPARRETRCDRTCLCSRSARCPDRHDRGDDGEELRRALAGVDTHRVPRNPRRHVSQHGRRRHDQGAARAGCDPAARHGLRLPRGPDARGQDRGAALGCVVQRGILAHHAPGPTARGLCERRRRRGAGAAPKHAAGQVGADQRAAHIWRTGRRCAAHTVDPCASAQSHGGAAAHVAAQSAQGAGDARGCAPRVLQGGRCAAP